MAVRVPIPKSVRFEVFKRDDFSCQYCGRHPPDVTLEVDHIIAVANGGTNAAENLLSACFDCNRGKAARPLSSAPKSLAAKGAEVAELEEQIAGYRAIMEARGHRIERDAFAIAAVLLFKEPGTAFDVNRGWLDSIRLFNRRLDFYEVKEAAELAAERLPFRYTPRFKYFCGVCWRKIERKTDQSRDSAKESG